MLPPCFVVPQIFFLFGVPLGALMTTASITCLGGPGSRAWQQGRQQQGRHLALAVQMCSTSAGSFTFRFAAALSTACWYSMVCSRGEDERSNMCSCTGPVDSYTQVSSLSLFWVHGCVRQGRSLPTPRYCRRSLCATVCILSTLHDSQTHRDHAVHTNLNGNGHSCPGIPFHTRALTGTRPAVPHFHTGGLPMLIVVEQAGCS